MKSIKPILQFISIAFSLFLFTTCSNNSPTAPIIKSAEEVLNEAINAEMILDNIPSIAAGIVKEDKLVWQNYYGFSNIASQTTPTSESIYVLASVSKTITATAAMQLYEQGKINLDEDINNYLPFEVRNPNFPEVPLTTRMLLTHRTGLAWPNSEDPNFYNTFRNVDIPALGRWLENYITPTGINYVAEIWKNVRPGNTVGYSNIGGALLGYVVEAVSGVTFAEYCKVNIFDPLEMVNTSFRLSDLDQSKLATLYSGGTVNGQYQVFFYPSTTAKSTVADLSHYLIAYINGGIYKSKRILDESTINEMLSLRISGSGIGFIWWSQGNNWMGHTGGFVGVSSSIDIHRAKKLGVIILCNQGGVSSVYPGGDIYKLLHDHAESFL